MRELQLRAGWSDTRSWHARVGPREQPTTDGGGYDPTRSLPKVTTLRFYCIKETSLPVWGVVLWYHCLKGCCSLLHPESQAEPIHNLVSNPFRMTCS